MKPANHMILLLAALLASPAGIAASSDAPVGSASIRVELKDGLLSAEFHDAPLPRILAEIGRVAGFKLVQVADFNDFRSISGSFENRPLQLAIERLVADTNRILFFSPGAGADSDHILSQLWLLGPGEAGANLTQQVEIVDRLQHDEPLIRRQAVLSLVQQEGEEAVLDKLSMLLQTDRDPLVRSRAAIALGSLQDERAIPELEAALRDTHFSVRAQSMKALGLIGGDRAAMKLGNILLDDKIDARERVLAAQALWKQDSEIARGYLQAGSNDANEQVRAAASKVSDVSVAPAAAPGATE
jgi:hypothetical protein